MTQFVTNDVIATDAVNATSIAAGAVGSSELATDAVTAVKIAADAVTTVKILNSNVTTAKIADDAVTTVKILNANVTPAKLSQPMTLDTFTNLNTLTQKDFTIPSWAKRVTVMIAGVSLSGTDLVRFQVGNSGGVLTSGYSGSGSAIQSGVASVALANGFDVYNSAPAATDVYSGSLVLTLADSATYQWVASGVFANHATGRTFVTAGTVVFGAGTPLTTVRIRPSTTNTFDAGSVNVMYE